MKTNLESSPNCAGPGQPEVGRPDGRACASLRPSRGCPCPRTSCCFSSAGRAVQLRLQRVPRALAWSPLPFLDGPASQLESPINVLCNQGYRPPLWFHRHFLRGSSKAASVTAQEIRPKDRESVTRQVTQPAHGRATPAGSLRSAPATTLGSPPPAESPPTCSEEVPPEPPAGGRGAEHSEERLGGKARAPGPREGGV